MHALSHLLLYIIYVFVTANFDKFWAVNKKLMLNLRGEHTPFQHIPFCAYRVSMQTSSDYTCVMTLFFVITVG